MSSEPALNGVRKAAILVVLLGEDAASRMFKCLPEPDLQMLTEAIADLERVNPETAVKVLEEYQRLSMTQEYLAEGGREYAHRLLVKAFGDEGAKNLMEQVARAQEISASKLDSLQKCDPLQLSKFLEGERTGTVVIGREVKLGAVSILQGNLSIEISTAMGVSQPPPFSNGETARIAQPAVKAEESKARRIELREGATVQDLVNGLQAIGASTRDVISILQAIKSAGALRAELEVI
jgi:hypothetical protein